MSETAQLLNIIFLSLIAFYVCLQAAELIVEVAKVEKTLNVPPAFSAKITLLEHRKAIDYTSERSQADSLYAFVGAAIALAMTSGGVLNVLWSGIITLLGQGILAQFLLVAIITLILMLIDFPLAWWKNFRINERYGYERTEEKLWLENLCKESLIGWIISLPIIFFVLFILSIITYYWWSLAICVTSLGLLYHYWFVPNYLVGFSSKAKPIENEALKKRIQSMLREYGLTNVPIVTMPRPALIEHKHSLLVQRGFKRQLIIFEHCFETLNEDEVTAVAATAIGHNRHWHTFALLLLLIPFTSLLWYGFSILSNQTFFYEALNINPISALENGAPIPGLLLSILIVIAPVILYPLILFIHAYTRMLEYDEDTYAVFLVGAEALICAMVKLHQDYRNTLTPNRFYSLCNHRRPHIIHRIKSAISKDNCAKEMNQRAQKKTDEDRAKLFNALHKRRQQSYEERRRKETLRQEERDSESNALLTRNFTV